MDWIIKYWIEVLFGLITAGLGLAFKELHGKYKKMKVDHENRLKQQEDEQAIIKQAVVALLHDRMFQACKHCLIEGEITADELDNITLMYNAYSGLGGNGTGTEIYNRTKNLRLKIKEEE